MFSSSPPKCGRIEEVIHSVNARINAEADNLLNMSWWIARYVCIMFWDNIVLGWPDYVSSAVLHSTQVDVMQNHPILRLMSVQWHNDADLVFSRSYSTDSHFNYCLLAAELTMCRLPVDSQTVGIIFSTVAVFDLMHLKSVLFFKFWLNLCKPNSTFNFVRKWACNWITLITYLMCSLDAR